MLIPSRRGRYGDRLVQFTLHLISLAPGSRPRYTALPWSSSAVIMEPREWEGKVVGIPVPGELKAVGFCRDFSQGQNLTYASFRRSWNRRWPPKPLLVPQIVSAKGGRSWQSGSESEQTNGSSMIYDAGSMPSGGSTGHSNSTISHARQHTVRLRCTCAECGGSLASFARYNFSLTA